MSDRILFVDDDENLLRAVVRNLKKEFDIVTAPQGITALQMLLNDGPFAVIVSDERMPGMTGIELLSKAKRVAPSTTRVMLTGNADMETAIEAVNQGQIYRFLQKPTRAPALAEILREGLELYHLRSAKTELLEDTVRGSVRVLIEMMSLVNPLAFSRSERMGKIVQHLSRELKLVEPWEFEVAALLSHLGTVTLPPAMIEKEFNGAEMNRDDRTKFKQAIALSVDMVAKIPNLEQCAEMIARHDSPRFSALDLSQPNDMDRVDLGAYLLYVARSYDRRWIDMAQTVEKYPVEIANILNRFSQESEQLQIRSVGVYEIQEGHVLQDAIFTKSGTLLAARGQTVTRAMLERIRAFANLMGIVEPIRVSVE